MTRNINTENKINTRKFSRYSGTLYSPLKLVNQRRLKTSFIQRFPVLAIEPFCMVIMFKRSLRRTLNLISNVKWLNKTM